MAQITTHTHEDEPPRRPKGLGGEPAGRAGDARTQAAEGESDRDERERQSEEQRIAAVGGDAEDALDHEEPLESYELHEDDEDVLELQTDSLLDETPVPDDAHLADFERRAGQRPPSKGPPDHHRLVAIPEEMGARVLEELTQSDPTDAEEERELFETLPTDKELEIRVREPAEDEDMALEDEDEDEQVDALSTPTGSPGE